MIHQINVFVHQINLQSDNYVHITKSPELFSQRHNFIHQLVHSPDGQNTWDRAKLKPRVPSWTRMWEEVTLALGPSCVVFPRPPAGNQIKAEQPGLEQVPPWDARIIGISFTCYATMWTPRNKILNRSLTTQFRQLNFKK